MQHFHSKLPVSFFFGPGKRQAPLLRCELLRLEEEHLGEAELGGGTLRAHRGHRESNRETHGAVAVGGVDVEGGVAVHRS